VVHLAERNPRVRELWQWLINEATPDDIRAIPHEQERKVFESRHVMGVGIHGGKLISDFNLTEMQERLWRLWMRHPSHDGALRMSRVPKPGGYFIQSTVDKIIAGLPHIKKWKVYADYRDLPDLSGTWEIDPPYQGVSDVINRFYCSDKEKINYDELREWVLSRRGLRIVHDVKGATWLPFEHLTSRNVRHPRSTDTSTELVHVSVHMSGHTDSARYRR
jgi:hypothetical protein